MSDPDSPPASISVHKKRCSISDHSRCMTEPQVSGDIKSTNENIVPVTNIPTITTSSPKSKPPQRIYHSNCLR